MSPTMTIDADHKVLDAENLKKLTDLKNEFVLDIVEKYIKLCKPAKVRVLTDKKGDLDYARKLALKNGEEKKLAMSGHTMRIPAGGRCYIFKRWDQLAPGDIPEVAIFFARPEVLSGLFTLANFDQTDPNGGVICPFGAGCGSIIYYPWIEQQGENPRAVLGMFDPSARPCVPLDILTMAIPMKKFVKMVGYMEESFLITPSWEKVKRKIARSAEIHSR